MRTARITLRELRRTRGRIITASSLAGKNGVPTRSGYAAGKHAMVGLFDSQLIAPAAADCVARH